MLAPGWLIRWSNRQALAARKAEQRERLAIAARREPPCEHDELERIGEVTRCLACGLTVAWHHDRRPVSRSRW